MIKKNFLLIFMLFSVSAFAADKNNSQSASAMLACPKASATDSSNFCSTFNEAATCYCSQSLPPSLCQNMKALYKRMTDLFGDLDRACEYAARTQNTTKQECMDGWNCYIKGGTDSTGKSCSGTGRACE